MKKGITIGLGALILLAGAWCWEAARTVPVQAQSRSIPAADQEKVNDLVLANRILASNELGILDVWGHVSVRSSANPNHYYITRYVSPGAAKVEDVIENTLDSVAVGSPRTDEYQERFIHGEIYKARPDVMAVVHAHTPELVVFGISSVPLLTLGSPLPNFDLRTANGGKPGIVTTPALGAALAKTLGKSPAVLMMGHGVAVTDTSLPGLVTRLNQMRRDAQVEMMAISLGSKLTVASAQSVFSPSARNGDWETWKAMVMRRMAAERPPAPRKQSTMAEDTVLANNMLAVPDVGVLDTMGEVSVRNPDNPKQFYVIRNVPPSRATPQDVMESDLDCKPAGGASGSMRTEIYIHCSIYAARPDVMSIVHAHTPEVEAFSKSPVAVRPMANLGRFMGDGLPKLDIRGPGVTDVNIDNMAKGKKVAEALGMKPGVILANHGFVVVDNSVYTIVSRAHDMRLNVQIQLQAIQLGGKITYTVPLPGADGNLPAPGDTAPTPKALKGTGGGTALDRAWEYWRQMVVNPM